jgi:biofilm PGA synthesis N-glycosyltransferase PgaC
METIFWTSVYLIIYSYLIYPLLLLSIHGCSRKWRVEISDDLPSVSMIVAAHNEEKVIAEKIRNSLGVDYPKDRFEIIIGSDGSDDGTVKILNDNKADNIKVFDFKERRGKINVLKDLVKMAKGEIIVFSDANTMYDHSAIKRLASYFCVPRIGCVCGRLKLIRSGHSKEDACEGLYWKYESIIKRREGELGSVLGANGGIYAIRKELFPDIPGDTIIEDFLIPITILQKGYRVVYEKEAVAYEEASKTIVDEGRRKVRIGAGAYQTLFLTLPMLNIFLGFPSFAYWSHKVIRWFVPFLMILIFILNIFLAGPALYNYTLLGQLFLYGGALVGYSISKIKLHNRIFSMMYYFVAMNVSLLLGFCRFISGSQQVTWRRAGR